MMSKTEKLPFFRHFIRLRFSYGSPYYKPPKTRNNPEFSGFFVALRVSKSVKKRQYFSYF